MLLAGRLCHSIREDKKWNALAIYRPNEEKHINAAM
jgi:hypothetical protein